MAKSSRTKGTKTTIKVKNLATSEKKLNAKQMKKVKGGHQLGEPLINAATVKGGIFPVKSGGGTK